MTEQHHSSSLLGSALAQPDVLAMAEKQTSSGQATHGFSNSLSSHSWNNTDFGEKLFESVVVSLFKIRQLAGLCVLGKI